MPCRGSKVNHKNNPTLELMPSYLLSNLSLLFHPASSFALTLLQPFLFRCSLNSASTH